MPQIIVDTATESPASLRLLATLLTGYATLADAGETADIAAAQVAAATVSSLTIAPPQPNMPPGFPQAAPIADTVTVAAISMELPSLDPAVVFRKQVPPGTNILPFPSPPAPTVPVATAPAVPTALTMPLIVTPVALPVAPLPVSGTPAFAPAAGASSPVSGVAPPSIPPTAADFDSANIPWDARIHQQGKNKKTDGTWKLKKGLDPAIATAVMAGLIANKNASARFAAATVEGQTVILPTLPVAPVTVPLPLPPVLLPAKIPAPVGLPSLPPPPVGLPVPALPDGVPATPIELFRAMMVKISAALGVQATTNELVKQAHVGLGLPQLQLAITRPDLIPAIEAALGL